MAGVKGRSGGARPGSGRKPKSQAGVTVELEPQPHGGALKRSVAVAPPNVAAEGALPVTEEPLAFLLAVQNSHAVDIKTRVRAAIAAAQYKHMKKGDGGKKDEAAERSKKAAGGRFSPKAPPRLVVNNGG